MLGRTSIRWGSFFFEMVAGRPPYVGKSAQSVLMQVMNDDPVPDVRDFERDIAPEIATLIRRMCVKERGRRISSAEVLLSEFAKLGYGKVETDFAGSSVVEIAQADDRSVGEILRELELSDDVVSTETGGKGNMKTVLVVAAVSVAVLALIAAILL